MALGGSLLAIGLVALLVLFQRRMISPARFAQAVAGLALGAGLIVSLAQALETHHG